MKYIFYSSVHFIKGYTRSVVYESDRSMTYLVPNNFEEIYHVANNEGLLLDKIETNTLDLILKNDLIFEVTNDLLFSFPKPQLLNYSHLKISNLIVEYSLYNLSYLASKTSVFLETNLYFKLSSINIDYDLLGHVLEQNQSDSVEFGLFNRELLNSKLIKFMNSINKLITINCFFNLNDFNHENKLDDLDLMKIRILERDFDNHALSTGVRHFYEAHNNHTYFNNKLFLKHDGFLSIFESDGGPMINLSNCSRSALDNFINTQEVNELWFTKKENTLVCKDCENRFFCVDKRTPKFNDFGVYHEIECSYNPYIAKWKGEEGYLTLVECGVISNENEFSINHEKIAQINKELWENED